ncbi:hypothetical protein C8R47DRAFT_1325945 [Mycena vitilis]|nr:hypothetical protein C8R47DRAFT_1325945 [Mycena vitilis]
MRNLANACHSAMRKSSFMTRSLCSRGKSPSKAGMAHCSRSSKSRAPSFFISDAFVAKRRIEDTFDYKAAYHIQLAKNASKSKKKHAGSDTEPPRKSLQGMGRGIRKLAALFGEIVHIIADAQAYERNPMADDHGIDPSSKTLTQEERTFLAKKRGHERNYEAYVIVDRLIPGLTAQIAGLSIPEKVDYFVLIQKGANDARSDDFSRPAVISSLEITAERFDHSPSVMVMNEKTGREELVQQRAPLLDDRSTRGVEHDITGALLTVRTAFRDKLDLSQDFFFRVFYEGFETPPPKKVTQGFLRGRYLVKTYKAVFTAPTSAEVEEDQNDRNAPPRKKRKRATGQAIGKNVATLLGMNGEVTPRSIAYIAVLVWFSLTTAFSWNVQEFYKVSLHQLYDFIVDFLESPEDGFWERVDALLSWWNQQIFPNHGASAATSQAAVASRAALWEEEDA